jgi:hypothetical protein
MRGGCLRRCVRACGGAVMMPSVRRPRVPPVPGCGPVCGAASWRAAFKPSSGLKPALLPRKAVRLDSIAGVQLADCFRQIIAHRAMRKA